MTTAIATGKGNALGQGQFAGIGLAIPVSMIDNVVEQLITSGEVEKGFMGVSTVDVEEVRQGRFRDPLAFSLCVQESLSRGSQQIDAIQFLPDDEF